MQLSDLKDGMTVILDAGFTCADAGPTVVHLDTTEHGGFYFACRGEYTEEDAKTGRKTAGPLIDRHYVDGQEDENGELVGISLP